MVVPYLGAGAGKDHTVPETLAWRAHEQESGSLPMGEAVKGWGGLALAGDGTTEVNLHLSASDGSFRPNPVSLVLLQDQGLGS